MGWQNMPRPKTQMAKAKRKISAMIPNISINFRLYCCPTTTQEKLKLSSSATPLNIRSSSVACIYFTEPYLPENTQKTEIFIHISIPKSSNRSQLR